MIAEYEKIAIGSTFPMRCFLNRLSTPAEWVHPHWHEAIEVLFVLSGEALQQVNEQSFPLSTGDIACIPGGAIHATIACGTAPCSIRVFQFSASLGDARPPDEEAGIPLPLPLHLRARDHGTAGFASDLRLILRAWDRKDPGTERLCRGHLLMFHARAERLFAEHAGVGRALPLEARSRRMLSKTFQLIDDGFGRPIPLAQAAQRSNLSVAHFCRLFRSATGRSFKEYLTAFRVDKASLLLADPASGELAIARIADRCGFGSVFSMIRAFRNAYGCTPSEFRERSIGGVEEA